MSELKPCPFCGGEASKRLFYKGKYRVHCNVCDAHSGDVVDTEAEAIAAWNIRAERTCEFNIKDNMNETEGMGDVWIECSTCHCVFDYFADDWLMKMSYCPNCGARVKDVDNDN